MRLETDISVQLMNEKIKMNVQVLRNFVQVMIFFQ